MSWMLKPNADSYAWSAGRTPFISTEIEVDNDLLRVNISSVNIRIGNMYEMMYQGFDVTKYKTQDDNIVEINIMLVGNIPRHLHEQLYQLAIAINGGGMILQFKDDFATGTSASPITYNCRWINAGDFVESNAIQSGGSINLISYELPSEIAVTEFQKTIALPISGLAWNLQINSSGADNIYYRVIG